MFSAVRCFIKERHQLGQAYLNLRLAHLHKGGLNKSMEHSSTEKESNPWWMKQMKTTVSVVTVAWVSGGLQLEYGGIIVLTSINSLKLRYIYLSFPEVLTLAHSFIYRFCCTSVISFHNIRQKVEIFTADNVQNWKTYTVTLQSICKYVLWIFTSRLFLLGLLQQGFLH